MRLLLLLSLVLPVSAASDLSRVPDTELLAHYQKLRTALLDPARAALTENFVLKKDLASFEFKNEICISSNPSPNGWPAPCLSATVCCA